MKPFLRWSSDRYSDIPVFYRVVFGGLLASVPPLLLVFVLGRRGVLNQVSGQGFFGYVSFALLLLMLLQVAILKKVFEPIIQLLDAVERLQDGDHSLRAPEDLLDGPELSRVGNILNMIIDHLESNRHYTSSRTLQALERERMRIARELHDETSQSLSSLIINLEMIISTLKNQAVQSHLVEDLMEQLEKTRDLTETTLEEIRKLIFDLRPSILDDLGLIPAMKWYVMNKLEPLDIESRFNIQGAHEDRLPPDTETALFRIFQEAITNVIRHADANSVDVLMQVSDEAVRLTIEDDGIGFEPHEREDRLKTYEGLGLFGMQERARLMGGQLKIQAALGEGTKVMVQIPRTG